MNRPMNERAMLLLNILSRLRKIDCLFPDVREKLFQTETSVLREIAGSHFERKVFEKVRPSRNL